MTGAAAGGDVGEATADADAVKPREVGDADGPAGRADGGAELGVATRSRVPAVPCTGWSSADPTRPPMIHASSSTASTHTPTATPRRRQYTAGGSGPVGSIMRRR
jgi:hypothetical protein